MNTVVDDIARVNGVPLHDAEEALDDTSLRQRACTELLRQAAVAAGFEDTSAADAIERLLDQELQVAEPAEDACRRHFESHRARYGRGERLWLRHVLFAVTPGVDVSRCASAPRRCCWSCTSRTALRPNAPPSLFDLDHSAPRTPSLESRKKGEPMYKNLLRVLH